ncbi:MAG: ABC transporter permease [Polyangiaceae bacterium]|nr:ABC transporter permease [Polyangiaceae bacterium]
MYTFLRALFERFAVLIAWRSLRADRFGTFAAIVGVALGAATVNVVLVLDTNTRVIESRSWTLNPDLDVRASTVELKGILADGTEVLPADAKTETHEDYVVMRSAIRLGSLSAYLVGALIVFFTFAAVIERRKREVALYRSLGALPEQVAAVLVREAFIVAAAGAALGVLAAVPLSWLAAAAGMTTTGRARIHPGEMTWPLARMAIVSAVGGFTALLGVIRPVRDVLRVPVADALVGRSDTSVHTESKKVRGLARIALPFTVLLFVLMRPFFKSALPSLAFFAVEAGVVCALALATVVLVPDVVGYVGSLFSKLLPTKRSAVRLLVTRRIEQRGHEFGLPVAGIMLVLALLLSLHIAVYALKREVIDWAKSGVDKCLFVVPDKLKLSAEPVVAVLPERALVIKATSRTPWPNAVHAVESGGLVRWANALGRDDLKAIAARGGPGTVVLSTMMARRFGVRENDFLEVRGKGAARRLKVAGVTDALGYTLALDAYRNGKTYAVLDEADVDLIAPYVQPIGWSAVVIDSERPNDPDFRTLMKPVLDREHETRGVFLRGLHVLPGEGFMAERVRETGRDFWIFDVILALTSVLAAVGVANQLGILVHARRRELLLYRTLGMTAGEVRQIVLGEGAFTGLVGGSLAVLLGVPLGYATIGALRAVSAFDVSFSLPLRYVAVVISGAVALSLVAALYPARKAAASLDRVEHEG